MLVFSQIERLPNFITLLKGNYYPSIIVIKCLKRLSIQGIWGIAPLETPNFTVCENSRFSLKIVTKGRTHIYTDRDAKNASRTILEISFSKFFREWERRFSLMGAK